MSLPKPLESSGGAVRNHTSVLASKISNCTTDRTA